MAELGDRPDPCERKCQRLYFGLDPCLDVCWHVAISPPHDDGYHHLCTPECPDYDPKWISGLMGPCSCGGNHAGLTCPRKAGRPRD